MIYQIHRYPADLIDVVRLAGGQRVVIRPVLPQDEDADRRLLPRPVGAGALRPLHEPDARAAARACCSASRSVDYADHLALVAEVFADGRETVIAEARYVRGADRDAAEFAVSVAEPWQGKGLASLMLGKLACRAAAAGVDAHRRRDAGQQRAHAVASPARPASRSGRAPMCAA